MTTIETILVGVISSIIASLIFWILTFKISRTEVLFSDKLEKSASAVHPNGSRIRIRFVNYGRRDLIEVSIKARIMVKIKSKENTTRNHTFLSIGNEGFFPVLRGLHQDSHPWEYFTKKNITTQILTVYIGEVASGEFQKNFYPKSIQKKAKEGTLTVWDIYEKFKNSVSVRFYLFGCDRVTGARRIFESKDYKLKDICEGDYAPIKMGRHFNKASTLRLISEINERREEAPAIQQE